MSLPRSRAEVHLLPSPPAPSSLLRLLSFAPAPPLLRYSRNLSFALDIAAISAETIHLSFRLPAAAPAFTTPSAALATTCLLALLALLPSRYRRRRAAALAATSEAPAEAALDGKQELQGELLATRFAAGDAAGIAVGGAVGGGGVSRRKRGATAAM